MGFVGSGSWPAVSMAGGVVPEKQPGQRNLRRGRPALPGGFRGGRKPKGTAGDHRGPEPGRGRQEGWRFDALRGDPEQLEQPCRRADPKGTKTAALADVVGAARRRTGRGACFRTIFRTNAVNLGWRVFKRSRIVRTCAPKAPAGRSFDTSSRSSVRLTVVSLPRCRRSLVVTCMDGHGDRRSREPGAHFSSTSIRSVTRAANRPNSRWLPWKSSSLRSSWRGCHGQAGIAPRPEVPVLGAALDPPHGVPPEFQRGTPADISRAKTLMGWEPAVDWEAAVSRTVSWFSERLAVDSIVAAS